VREPAARASQFPDVAPPLRPLPRLRIGFLAAGIEAALLFTAFVLSFGWRHEQSLAPHVLGFGALATAVVLAVFFTAGLYDGRVLAGGLSHARRLIQAWLLVTAILAIGLFLAKAEPPLRSRLATTVFVFVGGAVVAGLRLGILAPGLRRMHGRSLRGARVIVGQGRTARRLAAAASPMGPVLVGFVDADPAAGEALPAPYLGGLDVVDALAAERRISEVLVAREDLSRGDLVELAQGWMARGLEVTLASTAFEVMVARASGGVLGGVPVVELKATPQAGPALTLKRVLDVVVVLVGGLFVLPVLLGVALAVRWSSPGPILFRQERVGRRGRRFTMFKFRSMVADGNDMQHRAFVKDLMNGHGVQTTDGGKRVYKLVNDPRITRVGRVIRRLSLDELPQLWNVMRGDMSLVGPRPCLPYEWDLYEPWQRRRLNALPGITGLWQVTARSRVSFEDMVLLDLHYIANWSLAGDLSLLARTVPVVLGGQGGH